MLCLLPPSDLHHMVPYARRRLTVAGMSSIRGLNDRVIGNLRVLLLEMIASGVVATAFLDLWQRLLRLLTGLPAGNWAFVGRWFVHALRGRFMHSPIAASPEVPNELPIGWVFHYAVGVVYGVVYVLLLRYGLGLEPTLLNGLVFGVLSTVVPWFFFMPVMGAGVLGSKTPAPLKACLQALASHAAFGLGLAVGAMVV
jgi:hypothetical protein